MLRHGALGDARQQGANPAQPQRWRLFRHANRKGDGKAGKPWLASAPTNEALLGRKSPGAGGFAAIPDPAERQFALKRSEFFHVRLGREASRTAPCSPLANLSFAGKGEAWLNCPYAE